MGIYFAYPFHGPKADLHGRPGSGFELENVDLAKGSALAVILPNGRVPFVTYVQGDDFRTFEAAWNRFTSRHFNSSNFKFSKVEASSDPEFLPPFDDVTLSIISRSNGTLSELRIYAPKWVCTQLADREEGRELKLFLEACYRLVGKLTI